ncbi:hypothetical protein HYU50_05455 [Candidatus Woesearchaeota archaeon]|nr:hypothetical protein [Candidatus Woesearchaeota archaeon]
MIEQAGQMLANGNGANGVNGRNGTNTSHLEPKLNNGHSPRKRNKVGIISPDSALIETLGGELIKRDFDVRNLTIDDVASDYNPQNFYFVDTQGLGNYSAVRGKIKALREKFPDSELVLLLSQSAMSSPQMLPLQSSINKHLVPKYNRPEEGSDRGTEYKKLVARLAKHIESYLSQPSLIKIGGSIFDLYKKNPDVLMNLVSKVNSLHNAGYPIMLTSGGGPSHDIEKDLSATYGTSPASGEILQTQARRIVEILGNVAEYVPPEKMKNMSFSREYLTDKIPVISLSGLPYLLEHESDTHTLATGEKQKLYKVIFAKHTDGIYERDPWTEPRRIRVILWSLELTRVAPNRFFPFIYASDILNGVINRQDSEGQGEHLIETGALTFLKYTTRSLRAVQVINGTKPNMLKHALDGERYLPDGNYVGSFILKG